MITNNKPLLYSFRRCPYAMRARMALKVSGIQYVTHEVVLWDKPAGLLKISPKGTVPVLQLPDGTVIEESLDIMRYALKQHDPDGWLKEDAEQTDYLIEQNDTKFKHWLDRYKYPSRYDNVTDNGNEAFNHAVAILNNLNNNLLSYKGLVALQYTLADYAIFPFVRQFAHVDKERFLALGLTALSNWLEYHLTSPLFQDIMQKK